MKDSFYTSPELAAHLVSYIGNYDIKTAVDFCIGEGELIRAAQMKFEGLKCFGTDIDGSVLTNVKKEHPSWILEKCDFTCEESRKTCSLLSNNRYDLILLNPPFTCKGSTAIHNVSFNNTMYHVSTAMSFLVEALKYLSNDGILLAILPISVVYSQKDEKIREALKLECDFNILEERDNQRFKNCNPNIVIVSLSLNKTKNQKQICSPKLLPLNRKVNLKVIRGNLSMYEMPKYRDSAGIALIHSTNIRNNSICLDGTLVNKKEFKIEGPAVLIHRVGKPDITKIGLIKANEKYVLSDCILGILCDNYNDAKYILKQLIFHETLFCSLYKGTGAKYITIERLKQFLGIL